MANIAQGKAKCYICHETFKSCIFYTKWQCFKVFLPNQALATPSLLKEVSNLCRLPSMSCAAPGSTYIPLKTTPTVGLLLARTTLKPKVQDSNTAHDIFSSHHHVYVLMLACGSAKGTIACNSSLPQPVRTPTSI